MPEPLGTVAEIWLSLSTLTAGEAFVPKNTDRMPAAPEKFWPLTVIALPGGPFVGLRPVTIGVSVTTSKLLALKTFRPVEPLMSLLSQTRVRLLLAFTEPDAPV